MRTAPTSALACCPSAHLTAVASAEALLRLNGARREREREAIVGAGRNSSMGFTLLELLVVMVIIGLLASYVAPRYFDQIGKSEIKTARAQLDAFDKALATIRLKTATFPLPEQVS